MLGSRTLEQPLLPDLSTARSEPLEIANCRIAKGSNDKTSNAYIMGSNKDLG